MDIPFAVKRPGLVYFRLGDIIVIACKLCVASDVSDMLIPYYPIHVAKSQMPYNRTIGPVLDVNSYISV